MKSMEFTVGDSVKYIGPNLPKGIKGVITKIVPYQQSIHGSWSGPWCGIAFEGRSNDLLCIPKNLKLLKPKMMIYRKEGLE